MTPLFPVTIADGKVDMDLVLQLYDRLDTAVWIFDFDHKRYLWANKKTLEITEAESLEELQSRDLAADMSPAVEQRLRQYQQDFKKSDTSFSEIWTLYPKGKPKVLQIAMSGVRLRDGRMGLLCEGREHHEQQPETLRSAEALLHTTVMISLFSRQGEPLYRNTASRAACVSLETQFQDQFVHPEDVQSIFDVVDRERSLKFVAQMKTNAGAKWHELTIRACHDAVSGQDAYLVSEIDVTELHETKERAQYLASHDTLTGLSNRTYLQERLTQILDVAKRNDQTATLYLLDLDDFKLVNDSLGHAAGDVLLQLVAEELKALAGPDDVIARLGGDEFLMCHLEKPGEEEPGWFGRALLDSFSKPRMIEGKQRQIGLSLGYAHFPDDGETVDELMRHADLALYQAKSDPNNKCIQFRDRMRRLRDEHRAIKKDLERALKEDQFVLYYQPIACTRTDRVVSGEALLRWQHPERGLIGPDEFIQIAEDTGLINDIGTWVAEQVANLQRRMHNLQNSVPLALNVSPRQLSDSAFLTLMQSLPFETGCTPGRISLEITESVILGDIPNARETLTSLKNCGYQIVIDDFGTGYSNLAYLHNYPIDGIKIDRMFMEDVESGGEIVKLILSLANALGANVVAEGVESIEQRSWLSQNGCNRYQGYLYSKPVPEERFLSMLETQSKIAAM
ncbi:EAL domain-containing protein [uncultured Roseibium sp.]|uniref:putative bifunctional diguanylate cyclase/phosphodiesterase n=1 Tax=uncultured Roseibium sp. TaxID=1936171 RepID=UPI00262F7F3B|nr:EAL domain-containing protein [uncultured Roseibium sp.]